MVELEPLELLEDIDLVRTMIARHVRHTQSAAAARILADWSAARQRFVKIMPREYKRVLLASAAAAASAHAAPQPIARVAAANG
jgi:glutamate synthase (NADPH/NADH) large chain